MDQMPPMIAPSPPAPQPKRTGWVVYGVIVTFLLFVCLLAVLVLIGFVFGDGARPATLTVHKPQYQEEFITGDTDTRNKIAVIYVTGVISSVADGYTTEEGMVGSIKEQLQAAVDDKLVKAIILRINSPGGEVVASDSIYNAVVEATNRKPIVASMDSVGASGAYYVAVGANRIVATDMTITGSIGVIMQSYTFGGLMDKVGVKSFTFKSGRYKDVLNPTREPTEDEKQLVQDLVMEVYDKFVGIVATERDIPVDKLKDGLADGRILSGKQAQEAGFIDDLGYFEDAIDIAKDLAKVEKAKVVTYIQPFTWRALARILGQNDRTKIQVELSPAQLKLQGGKLYFLPPYLFQ